MLHPQEHGPDVSHLEDQSEFTPQAVVEKLGLKLGDVVEIASDTEAPHRNIYSFIGLSAEGLGIIPLGFTGAGKRVLSNPEGELRHLVKLSGHEVRKLILKGTLGDVISIVKHDKQDRAIGRENLSRRYRMLVESIIKPAIRERDRFGERTSF